MCDSCGCDHSITPLSNGRSHDHEHNQGPSGRTIEVKQDVLSKNNELAIHNREHFTARNIMALNLVSSPGSGKTTLLETTLNNTDIGISFAVIEGDQQTQRDADRIAATGVPVVQVNTGTGCHLDALMVHRALHDLPVRDNSVLFIENVGNLVCPAMFDLGEAYKVVMLSVTEGDDKPQKYPTMFQASQVCIITKTDLLPHVDFDIEASKKYIRALNKDMIIFEVSSKTGQGMQDWYDWLKEMASA